MKFLIQTFNGEIRYDFQLELINAIDAHNFFYADDKIEYYKKEIIEKITNPELYCPVGTVEFVLEYFNTNFGIEYVPKPINIPSELMKEKYLKRYVDNVSITNEFKDKHLSFDIDIFVKSNDIIKYENNGIYHNGFRNLPTGNFQVSSIINGIKAEFRCFILENKIIDVRQYDGDFRILPNFNLIDEMVLDYKSAPKSYTLDVAVTNDNDTVLIEAHDFFSCGLYGLKEIKKLPFMFWRWYYFYIKNKKNK